MSRANQVGGFLRSRADQLADYLRGCIARGEIAEPLPGIREWSGRLGVGHGTLQEALRILGREGVVSISARTRVRLLPSAATPKSHQRERIVRWVYIGKHAPDSSVWSELFMAISERLREHDIQLVPDRCDAARLRAIQQRGEQPDEMLLLISLRHPQQRWFADFRRSVLLVALPAPGIRLPYVWNDAEGAILHAIRELVRRGFSRICLVTEEHPHVGDTERWFLHTCTDFKPPLRGELVRLPVEVARQQTAAAKFARRIARKTGILVIYPIPATVLTSAFLAYGIDMPRQVEVVAINTMKHAVRMVPPPMYYPYPVEAFARVVARAAIQYFQRGTVPRLRKHIPLEVVRPSR
jgi:DNA-binding LacI/PurR family transcriptional regulator